jgi:hypothetical protein
MILIQIEMILKQVLRSVKDSIGSVLEDDFGKEVRVLRHKHSADWTFIFWRRLDRFPVAGK